jgi:hypothetical protein
MGLSRKRWWQISFFQRWILALIFEKNLNKLKKK